MLVVSALIRTAMIATDIDPAAVVAVRILAMPTLLGTMRTVIFDLLRPVATVRHGSTLALVGLNGIRPTGVVARMRPARQIAEDEHVVAGIAENRIVSASLIVAAAVFVVAHADNITAMLVMMTLR